jgi:hypothetical protein
MRDDGHSETVISIWFSHGHAFYSASPHWKPNFALQPIDPACISAALFLRRIVLVFNIKSGLISFSFSNRPHRSVWESFF